MKKYVDKTLSELRKCSDMDVCSSARLWKIISLLKTEHTVSFLRSLFSLNILKLIISTLEKYASL